MPSLVEFVGVSRSYGSRVAVDDIHLSLDPGELVFLVGPSGAGCRIGPFEVESALVEHPAVAEAAVWERWRSARSRSAAWRWGARFGEVEIDDLTVRRLRVVERHDGELPG